MRTFYREGYHVMTVIPVAEATPPQLDHVAPLPIVSTSKFFSRFLVGDFNNDGYLDLLFSQYGGGGGGLELLLGKGDGTFESPLYPYPDGTLNIAEGDFNGDDNLDVALLGGAYGDMVILLGNGNGTFKTGQSIPLAPTEASNFLAADLNGDGHIDLVTDYGRPIMTFYLGNGDGTFTQQGTEFPCVGVGVGCIAAIGDLNGDGKPDLVFSNNEGVLSPVSVLINTTQ